MNVTIERPDAQRLVATLRDGEVQTEVTGWRQDRAAADLLAALESAEQDGYGECFWPEPTGQYWWMFRRNDRRLEMVVLWSSGAVTGWQHVFRAADEMGFFHNRVREELTRHGLADPP